MKIWQEENIDGTVVHYFKPEKMWEEYIAGENLLFHEGKHVYTDNGSDFVWRKFELEFNKMKKKIDLLMADVK